MTVMGDQNTELASLEITNSISLNTPRHRDKTRAIGAILVESGKLTEHQIGEIQDFALKTGSLFGDAAVKLGLITNADVDSALSRQFNYPILGRDGVDGVGDEVISAYNPHSDVVENLRTVRSRLSLGWLDNTNRNVLAIVSPERGEGRSWFAANLATVFAQAGERTLLIDADMRHPKQHLMFKLDGQVGLSSLLTGRAGREIVRRIHPKLRLFVAPAGVLPPNPQELITREVFDIVIEQFSKQFDIIILDTPAASETADAELLASHAGAALMLSRRNKTRHASLLKAMDRLNRSGVKVVGSVVNNY